MNLLEACPIVVSLNFPEPSWELKRRKKGYAYVASPWVTFEESYAISRMDQGRRCIRMRHEDVAPPSFARGQIDIRFNDDISKQEKAVVKMVKTIEGIRNKDGWLAKIQKHRASLPYEIVDLVSAHADFESWLDSLGSSSDTKEFIPEIKTKSKKTLLSFLKNK